MPTFRTLSLLVAVAGWVLAAQEWIANPGPGLEPAFALGLSLGIVGTVVWALSNTARIYAIGFRDGVTTGRRGETA